MTPARPLAASVAALGIAGVFGVPAPATAAPAPCDRVERYAAQSGAELFRLNRLTLTPAADPRSPADGSPHAAPGGSANADDGDRPATEGGGRPAAGDGGRLEDGARTRSGDGGRPAGVGGRPADSLSAPAGLRRPGSSTVGDVRVGEAKSALVAQAAPNSAAVTRMVNGTGTRGLNEPLLQQAPPTNPQPLRRATAAAETGPLLVDSGSLLSHARWVPGMVCGVTDGKVTRAMATLRAVQVMGIGDDVLVAVPDKLESVSTTALERRGEGARTVAAATFEARTFELLNGAVTVKIVRPPTLEARMSTVDGGEVSYVPASLEVSGAGIEVSKLDTAGDTVELTIGKRDRPRSESRRVPAPGKPGTAPPLLLPNTPAVPALTDPAPEAAPVTGPGTHVRVSLGDVRQAARGHAVAARASAVRIAIDEAPAPGYEGRAATHLSLEMGVLESAAVAPEPGGDVSGGAAGAGGGLPDAGGALPLTGPRVDLLALGGVVLLGAGAGALAFGLRKRRFRA